MRLLALLGRLTHPVVLLAGIAMGCTGIIGEDGPAGSNGSGSGSGGTSGGGTATLPGGLKVSGQPSYYRFVRLTHEQWENSVRDALGLGTDSGLSSGFVPDPPAGTFRNNEKALYVSDVLRTDYQRAAETIAESVARDPVALAGVAGSDGTTAFIPELGRKLYRRPLTVDEQVRYESLFAAGKAFFESGDDFADGVQAVLEAMLQSPHFLYRVELSPDGSRLSGYELATKLSFLLRNTTPDDALLDAAESGLLDSDEDVIAIAEQMLSAPEAVAVLERFHAELFGLSRYKSILKDATLFPAYTDELNDVLHDADLLFFRHMFEGGFGLRDILTSNVAYVDETTAPLYGVSAPGPGLSEVVLDSSRPGFFTRLGFLAYNGTLRDPDPIHRGVDINNRILCVKVSPPPGEIPPLPDYVPGQTNRERVTAHTGEGVCGSCHNKIINPLGFALEGFDAIGQARDTDNGKPVDTSGEYAFDDGLKSFTGIDELTALLSESPQAHGCYSLNMAEFALGRDVAGGEAELIAALQKNSMEENASIKDIMMAIVRSPLFVMAKGGAQ